MSTVFSAKRRSQIAATLAAHGGSTPLALAYDRESQAEHGVSPAELERNRAGYSEDPLTEAALRFAHAALITRGRLEPRDVRAAERRGLSGDDLGALTALAAQISAEIITANAQKQLDKSNVCSIRSGSHADRLRLDPGIPAGGRPAHPGR